MRAARSLLLFTALIFLVGAGKRPPKSRPNIVFILADDLGWADLGCYGNTFHETPHIDRLAAEGTRFSSFYVQAASMPSRVGILTGKNPSRLASLWGGKQPMRITPWEPLPPEETTYAEALAKEGYATGHIGKWGVRHWKDQGEKDQGFAWLAANQDYYYLPDFKFPYGDHHLQDIPKGKDVGHLVDYMSGKAEEFIEINKDRPFLLTLSHYAVHTPVAGQGDDALVKKYKAKAKKLGLKRNADYAALLEQVDASTGRVMAKLKALGLDGRTLIVFLSDNGGANYPESRDISGRGDRDPITSNAPLREGKSTIYEGGIRVPMIARWPGKVKAGAVTEALGSMEDVFPTLLEAAGARVPKGAAPDGVSLLPLLTGGAGHARDSVFVQWDGAMLRKGRWKLIEFFPYNPTPEEIASLRKKAEKKGQAFTPPPPKPHAIELYDLEADLGESRNLAGAEPGLVKELRAELHAKLKEYHGAENYDPAKLP